MIFKVNILGKGRDVLETITADSEVYKFKLINSPNKENRKRVLPEETFKKLLEDNSIYSEGSIITSDVRKDGMKWVVPSSFRLKIDVPDDRPLPEKHKPGSQFESEMLRTFFTMASMFNT